jgi:hypothetical protein
MMAYHFCGQIRKKMMACPLFSHALRAAAANTLSHADVVSVLLAHDGC